MLLRVITAALLTGIAGSAFAADAIRPSPVAPAPIVIAPAPTAAGDLSIAGGGIWVNESFTGPGGSDSVGVAQAQGRASLPLGMGNWNFEAQVNAADLFVSDSGTTAGEPFQGAGYLHLWNRHAASAWGFFAGVSPFEITLTSVGGEFAHYLPHGSWGAAIAYTNISGLGGGNAWTANGNANLYFNPDSRLGFQGTALTVSEGGSSETLWQLSADLEHRSAMRPISLFASASYLKETSLFTGWTAVGGFRIYLDKPGSTLQSHEQDVPFTFQLPALIL